MASHRDTAPTMRPRGRADGTLAWRTLLLSMLLAVPSGGRIAWAAEHEGVTPIARGELFERLERGKPVRGRLVDGADLTAYVARARGAVALDACVVEGGVDFGSARRYTLDEVEDIFAKRRLPPGTLDALRESATSSADGRAIALVRHPFYIHNSRIVPARAGREATTLLSAAKVVFDRFSLRGTRIEGDTRFSDATFISEARFDGTEFDGDASFVRAAFPSGVSFMRGSFRRAGFNRARFAGARFQQARFAGTADFQFSRVRQRLDFSGARFSGDAFLFGTRSNETVFQGTVLDGDLSLRRGQVVSLDLRGARIGASTDLRDAHITELNMDNAIRRITVSGYFDVRRAVIRSIRLDNMVFGGDTDFSDAVLGGSKSRARRPRCVEDLPQTLFSFVTFRGDAVFQRARFLGETAFSRVNFKQGADFTGARFLGADKGLEPRLVLSYVNYPWLRLNWDQLPAPSRWGGTIGCDDDTEPRAQVLARLETDFRGRNRLGDGNRAYYARKRASLEDSRREPLTERVWAELEWVVWGASSGYGTRLDWVLGWNALVWFLFTWIYAASEHLERRSPPGSEADFSIRLRLLDPPALFTGEPFRVSASPAARRILDAARLSFVILLKVGYRDTRVSGRVLGIDVRWFVTAQWLLGYYLLAALVITLANTQPLLNRLISGLF